MAVLALVGLNGLVMVVGQTWVFPLSPYFLKEKAHALRLFAAHLPRCLLQGDAPLDPLIAAAEKRNHLPAGLLDALVEVESHHLSHRISAAGAMGPAQLTTNTALQLRVEDPFDPRQAIDGGGRYLSSALERFGKLDLAIAAYNAGPGNVRGHVPRNGETEFYVPRVLAEFALRMPLAKPLVAARSPTPGFARPSMNPKR